ncbi:hypothetical protein COCVIDRAFT_23437 [Bipolaris victoriae FI3]|uniref:Uncharacterized protein n=1 Tax=Bipolaris victoriae (strain FI3) TaxID=930091 RepID=W7EUP2_BIPV3|nr:hypothetical protein COCVIDRAFT_23437 [Bipolaris victoriae FI3]
MNPTTPPPSHLLHSIRQNWSIPPSDPHLIPPSLLANLPPTHLSTTLLTAIHRLSTLTLGQRERAYNLLNTYFQARMRERGGAAGMLEVEDVEKACGSARKMSCVRLTGEAQRDRADSVYLYASEREQNGEGVRNSIEDMAAREEVQAQGYLMQKRRVELAPIVTAQSGISAVAEAEAEGAVLSSFTPLFRRLRDELGSASVSASVEFGLDGQQQQGREVAEGEGSGSWGAKTDLSAAQRAVHEFNVRRLEMEGKKREYEDAAWRFEEARWRLEGVREGVISNR